MELQHKITSDIFQKLQQTLRQTALYVIFLPASK